MLKWYLDLNLLLLANLQVDMQGNVLESGTTNFGVNHPGFALHSTIHSARPDIKCVIHLHLPNIVAVSALLFCNFSECYTFKNILQELKNNMYYEEPILTGLTTLFPLNF